MFALAALRTHIHTGLCRLPPACCWQRTHGIALDGACTPSPAPLFSCDVTHLLPCFTALYATWSTAAPAPALSARVRVRARRAPRAVMRARRTAAAAAVLAACAAVASAAAPAAPPRDAAAWEAAAHAYVAAHEATFLEEVVSFASIPSVSAVPAHAADVRAAGEWTADKLRALGAQHVALMETGEPGAKRCCGGGGVCLQMVHDTCHAHADVKTLACAACAARRCRAGPPCGVRRLAARAGRADGPHLRSVRSRCFSALAHACTR
jgi:hypothetical protein